MRAPSLLALGFTGVLLSMPLQAAPEYEKRADLSEQLAQWVKQALGGDASAQRELAQRYYDGDGVEQDYAKAFELYSEAAEQGDAARLEVDAIGKTEVPNVALGYPASLGGDGVLYQVGKTWAIGE